MSNKSKCRQGFEAQRAAAVNVDWFTWQIAWHDALFTEVDSRPTVADQASAQVVLTASQVQAIAESRGRLEGEVWKFDGIGLSLLLYDVVQATVRAHPAPQAVTRDDVRALMIPAPEGALGPDDESSHCTSYNEAIEDVLELFEKVKP